MTLLSGVLNNDTPDCDRSRGFLEARALVCGSADSNWCSSPPGSGLAPQQDPSGVGSYLCLLLHSPHIDIGYNRYFYSLLDDTVNIGGQTDQGGLLLSLQKYSDWGALGVVAIISGVQSWNQMAIDGSGFEIYHCSQHLSSTLFLPCFCKLNLLSPGVGQIIVWASHAGTGHFQ